MFIDVLDEALGKLDNKTSDSDAPKGLRSALTKEITRTLENVLKDGEEFAPISMSSRRPKSWWLT